MKKSRFNVFIRSFVVSIIVLFCPLILLTAISIVYQNIRYIAFGETKQAITLLADGTVRILDYEFDLANLSWLKYPATIANQLLSGPIRLIYLALIWVRETIPSLITYFE